MQPLLEERASEGPPVSNISEERLALDEAIRAWVRKTHSHSSWSESSGGKIGIDFSALRTLFTELQRLRAPAPVLSEGEREALEAGVLALSYLSYGGGPFASDKERNMKAQAAILRAMAERGK